MAVDWSHHWKLGDLWGHHTQWRIVALQIPSYLACAEKVSSSPPHNGYIDYWLSKPHLQQMFSGGADLYETRKTMACIALLQV